MRFALGSDHAGLALKERMAARLRELGHEVADLGTHTDESVDYPDYGFAVGEAVAGGRADRGLLVCGTGLGMSYAANKVQGIRAALCTSPEMAEMSRRHNDANVLVLGGRTTPPEDATRILEAWLSSEFEGGRHERRVRKILEYEKKIGKES
jgi:RpiB/LacA/LacB family sugar-phosphate isomerase